MGTFVFKWAHPADEVYVTGTFDDWSKSEQLTKVGDVFEKTVTLPDASSKIYYKFVVDGNWTLDHTAPKEQDPEGNENNVLTPERIVKEAPVAAAIMSSAAPGSTTAELAKDAPLENNKADIPGTFPETPAAELEKEVKVAPLPAADNAVNPIKLAPGEPVPESITAQDVNSNVKLDQESYEKADTLPGDLTLPPVTQSTIPESSLPVVQSNDVTINSVAPESTTVELAASAPLEEPAVPEVVKESQEEAGVDPEASAIPSEVKEKEKVEEELLDKVPEAPSTSEGTAGVEPETDKSEADKSLLQTATETATGAAAAAAATVTATLAGAAATLPDSVKDQLPTSVQDAIAPAVQEEKREEVSPEVPEEVKESIAEAGESPEAAGNTAAVEDKKEVEAELLKEVKPVEAVGESSAKDEAKDPETPAEAPKEEAKPAEAKPAVNGGEATVAKDPETPAKPAAATSSDTTPSSSKATDSPATAEKKKKNRVSGFFGKIKGKLSHKEK